MKNAHFAFSYNFSSNTWEISEIICAKEIWATFSKKISNKFFGDFSSNTWKTQSLIFWKVAFFKYSRNNSQKKCYWFFWKSCPNFFCANNLWNFPSIRGKIVKKMPTLHFLTIFPRIPGKFQRLFAQNKFGQLLNQ